LTVDSRLALVLVPPVAADATDFSPAGQLLPGGPVTFPLVGLGDPHPQPGLAAHLTEFGPRPAAAAADDLLGTVAASELTGRGGGHFPVARKWQAVLAATERTGVLPVVVANGSEGEPASAKDAALLCFRPHLVLDGLARAAAAVRATESVLWLHGDAHAAHRAVVRAIEERRAGGLVETPVRLATGPSRYLSGESSAAVRALSGGPALPESRRIPTAVSGVDGRPTLVQNVETLARVGLLARTGVDAHRRTSLVTVVAGDRRTVLEVGPEVTISAALALGGWPVGVDPQAVLVGGYGGSWVALDDARDVPVDEASMRQAGLTLGAGVLAPLSPQACGVAEVARLAAYLADAGARQCGPCLFGLGALSTTLTGLVRGEGRRNDVRRLQGWAAEVAGRGACHHPDGAVRMVLSGLTTFAADVEAHRKGRPCSGAGAPGVLPVPDERP
jgi:NADH:ubiquinone oxidoreductase subunit F (NADH-binding)